MVTNTLPSQYVIFVLLCADVNLGQRRAHWELFSGAPQISSFLSPAVQHLHHKFPVSFLQLYSIFTTNFQFPFSSCRASSPQISSFLSPAVEHLHHKFPVSFLQLCRFLCFSFTPYSICLCPQQNHKLGARKRTSAETPFASSHLINFSWGEFVIMLH
jgi:hypothetical protein